MLAALAEAIEARDPYSRGHSRRVAALSEAVVRCLGWDEERIAMLRLGALLHDIGKLGVEVEVLGKPAPLTPDEVAQVRSHPAVGARMLEDVGEAQTALVCVLYHHERWDGLGYPSRRAATQIPLEARILALADAFDAMTSFRPYRSKVDPEAALAELTRCAGAQFDPRLTWVFAEAWTTGVAQSALAACEHAAAS